MADRSAAPMTAIIADDEKLAREELAFLLGGCPDLEVVGAAKNGLEAVRMIQDAVPDLAFLDVQMPGLDGMAVIRRLREQGSDLPYFVLTTAYDQYAVQAFSVEALDYLLKPVDRDRLNQTLERARRLIEESRAPFPETVPPASPQLPRRNKVLIKHENRYLIVDAGQVVYFRIDGGHIQVVTDKLEGTAAYKTIEEIQSELDPEVFWRVHRSYLVNVHKIREVIPWFKSSYQLRMEDKRQSTVPVSRIQTKRLRELLRI